LATSDTQIINLALIRVGAATIGSLTDQSREAEIAKKIYDPLRRELLESHLWNFALTRKTLGKLANGPDFGFEFYYAISSDVLRIIEFNGGESGTVGAGRPTVGIDLIPLWKVEYDPSTDTRVIATNDSKAEILYVHDIKDVTQYKPTFLEAFASRLAVEFSYVFTNSVNLTDSLQTRFEKKLALARSFDAQEGSPQQVDANLWLNQRF